MRCSHLGIVPLPLALILLGGCAGRGARFPEDWIGSWRGPLVTRGSSAVAGDVTMEIAIARTADPQRLDWTVIYDGPQGRQERPYQLVVRNRDEGRYAIDERNGIVLEARFLGDALYTWFATQGSNIVVREQLVRGSDADRIEVEFITAVDREVVTTGKDVEVRSLPPISVQRASLRRMAP